ncbi:hypothetical protein BDP27DRAFT_1361236 [Rhodocollybia butyracea]|uniref:Uncharacterized protein n=1 Tax=Rhodocollybia butyracea TaxID=206335 RepID=A0A9P5Q011_9AGAR|nr:hypothetical protein BDP27DRAFT_1361236 [Rhodocollybia butyracea]
MALLLHFLLLRHLLLLPAPAPAPVPTTLIPALGTGASASSPRDHLNAGAVLQWLQIQGLFEVPAASAIGAMRLVEEEEGGTIKDDMLCHQASPSKLHECGQLKPLLSRLSCHSIYFPNGHAMDQPRPKTKLAYLEQSTTLLQRDSRQYPSTSHVLRECNLVVDGNSFSCVTPLEWEPLDRMLVAVAEEDNEAVSLHETYIIGCCRLISGATEEHKSNSTSSALMTKAKTQDELLGLACAPLAVSNALDEVGDSDLLIDD